MPPRDRDYEWVNDEWCVNGCHRDHRSNLGLRAVLTPTHNLMYRFLLLLLFWFVSVSNFKKNEKMNTKRDIFYSKLLKKKLYGWKIILINHFKFLCLYFSSSTCCQPHHGRHRRPCPSCGSSPWPRSHFPLLVLWLFRTSCVFLSQCLERAFSLEIELLMVRERKGREDRRKRQIRMEVVMGETQQGGCLLSLKDDEREGRVRQMEMKMCFRTDFSY